MSEARTLIVRNSSGLHARPAARLVEVARGFEAELVIERGEKQASCMSLIAIMKLGVSEGSEITLRADGPDAVPALDRIEQLFDELAIEQSAGGAVA
jgi:phosphotransferase system HPr (HPr) family protein